MEVFFATAENKPVDGEELMVFLNTGTSSEPTWKPMGLGVESADMEYDWQKEDKKDIWGRTYSRMNNPIIKQSLDPWPIRGYDEAMQYILELAVVDQDAGALCAMDILIVHKYIRTGSATSSTYFAERYPASSIDMSKLSREGGGFLEAGTEMTCGGKRAIGSATLGDKTVSFEEEEAA